MVLLKIAPPESARSASPEPRRRRPGVMIAHQPDPQMPQRRLHDFGGADDIVVERRGKLKWMDGDEELKADTSDADGNVRPNDTFKFDGVRYARSDIFR